MGAVLPFGVACIGFGIGTTNKMLITPAEYSATVEAALYSLTYVEKHSVEIEYDQSTSAISRTIEDVLDLWDGGDGFPLPDYFRMRFDLNIPARVQKELGAQFGMEFDLPQPIRVYVQDAFHGPVAFVTLPNGGEDDEGSDAVVIARKYLEQHLPKGVNGHVYFDMIGPSPFHANFFLCKGKQAEGVHYDSLGFECDHFPSRGYPRLEFQYSPDVFESPDDAFDALRFELDNELDIYYMTRRMNVEEARKWPAISKIYEDLEALTDAGGPFAPFRRFREQPALLQRLLREVTRFSSQMKEDDLRIKNASRNVYETGVPSYLKRIVGEDGRQENYPIPEMVSYAEFLERRHMKMWEVSVLAIAALLGAIFASLLGSAASLLATLLGSR